MAQYDVIVVGARCAGSPTAMLLARYGYKVLLVDRATFPSDTISTHGIPYRGLVLLHKWGLYDRVKETNCPEITKATIDIGGFPLKGNVARSQEGLAWLMCPRRTVLDKLLVDTAIAAGVECREAFVVHEVLMEAGQVQGIRGASGHAPLQTERAPLVIGADGKHSLLARTVQAPTYREVPPLLCWYYTYWTDLQPDGFTAINRHHRHVLLIPTHDNLTCVLVGWPHTEFGQVRADLENQYLQAIRLVSPALADRIQGSQRAERYFGMADLPNFFRKPYGPGWALVGDAGYHKDPVNAQGISDAFRDAQLLAEAVHAGLSGQRPLLEALAGYEQQRNEDAFPLYEQTCQGASFEALPEELLRIRAALRNADQADIDLFLSASLGMVPGEQFFNSDNLNRLFQNADPA